MKDTFWILVCCLALLAGCVQSGTGAQNSGREAGYSTARMIEIGKRIYQEGLMADGEPIKATVMGGIEVSGSQFTCVHCHRRSGLGGPEGPKYVPPTNGYYLYAPREKVHMSRPAYTDDTLAEALGAGLNPLGKSFDEIMPIYDLPDLEMQALIAYLKVLSSEFSPGIDEEAIHIATVVDVSIPAEEREAMLGVIRSYFDDKNSKSRFEGRRRDYGPYYHDYKNKAYRQWKLHVWELSGSPESWPAQLEEHYRRQPVFTLFSGLVNGSWEPIHKFSEANRIPSLLPNNISPVVSESSDFYTFYFSKGVVLDAQVVLADLETEPSRRNILQVYRAGSVGEDAARALRRFAGEGNFTIEDLVLDREPASGELDDVVAGLRRTRTKNMILWLNGDDLAGLASRDGRFSKDLRIYLSSSLLEGEADRVPELFRPNGLLLHQYNLSEDQKIRFRRTENWLKSRGIAVTMPLLQGQTFFACMVLREGLMHIRLNFYRDYMLDVIDHVQRMAGFVANYPTVSFGPEQRYLAKGAYVIELATGRNRWIFPDH